MVKDGFEKIKALVVKKDVKDKKKLENLIFFLVLLVVTIIIINSIFKDDNSGADVKESFGDSSVVFVSGNNDNGLNEVDLEQSLENILSKIKGVGEVEVLITYSQSSKITPMYNETSSQSVTEENDSDGGTRKIESFDSNKQVVSDSNSNPVTEKITMPAVEGAVVIARGAGNTTVKNNIIAAVEAATGLSSHKIQVFEMKGD